MSTPALTTTIIATETVPLTIPILVGIAKEQFVVYSIIITIRVEVALSRELQRHPTTNGKFDLDTSVI